MLERVELEGEIERLWKAFHVRWQGGGGVQANEFDLEQVRL